MKKIILGVALLMCLNISVFADVIKEKPILVESELKFEVYRDKGIYRCVDISVESRKLLVRALKEETDASGYIQYKLRFIGNKELTGTNYSIKVSGVEKELAFDIYSNRYTCISVANYKNGE